MAAHLFSRTVLWNPATTKFLASFLSRSFATKPSSPSLPVLFLNRLRPLSAANFGRFGGVAGSTVRGMATRAATSSLNDNNPNWSNRPPKETILLDGCDFEHWLVVMDKPEGEPTRDEIIDRYIKTLAQVLGSEEEARMKIYSVSTRCYFAFGALVDEETSYKLKELPGVRWVLPDSYLDVKNKDYGGEPFINGQAVPYDPKYHEEWIRNNSRANERNRRNDRPRNFDRSRNFERRRENMQNRDFQNQGMQNRDFQNQGMQNRDFQNQGMQNSAPNMSGMPPSNTVPQNMGRISQNNMGGMSANTYGGTAPANNFGGTAPANNYGGMQPPANNFGGMQPPTNNYGAMQPPPNNYGGTQPPTSNYGGRQPPNSSYGAMQPPPNNYGGTQPPPNNYGGTQPPPNNYGGTQPTPNYNTGNMGGMQQNAGWSGNAPGNMQQSADGHAYQNSYPPRQ